MTITDRQTELRRIADDARRQCADIGAALWFYLCDNPDVTEDDVRLIARRISSLSRDVQKQRDARLSEGVDDSD